MKKITTLAVLIVGVMASGQALASGSAKMELKATIAPGSCDVTLPTASLGWDVDPDSIKNHLYTDLPAQLLTINVNCPGKMMFAVKAVDNNTTGLALAGPLPSMTGNYFRMKSLSEGISPTAGYSIKALTAGSSADQAKASGMVTFTNGIWSEQPDNADYAYFHTSIIGKDYALDMTTSEGENKYLRSSATNKTYAIEVQPWIAPSPEGTLGSAIEYSGSTTFEVIYI